MPETAKELPSDQPGTITARQRRALFALGKRRGMDLDGLRTLTPQGSISALTYRQAQAISRNLAARTPELWDSTQERKRTRREPTPDGVIRLRTQRQLETIEDLRLRAELSEASLFYVIKRATGVAGLAELGRRADASKVINTLWAIVRKRERKNGGASFPSVSEAGETRSCSGGS